MMDSILRRGPHNQQRWQRGLEGENHQAAKSEKMAINVRLLTLGTEVKAVHSVG